MRKSLLRCRVMDARKTVLVILTMIEIVRRFYIGLSLLKMTVLREIVLEFQELFLLSGWSFVCTFSLK